MKMRKIFPKYICCFYLLCQGWIAGAQDLSDLLDQYEKATQPAEQISTLKQIGTYYQSKQGYAKAIEYYEKALQLEKQENVPKEQLTKTHEALAYGYLLQNRYAGAKKHYQAVLTLHRQLQNQSGQIQALQALAFLAQGAKKYQEALGYQEQILLIHQEHKNHLEQIKTYNDMGLLYHQLNQEQTSLDTYLRALALGKSLNDASESEAEQAVILINTGVTLAHMRVFNESNQRFNEALEIYEKQGQIREVAQTHNYIAANYYVSGRNDRAISNALKALRLAEPIEAEEVLLNSYRILADAYQQEGNFVESRNYLKRYQNLKEKRSEQERSTQQKILQEQINFEKKENELKTLLADQEKQALALRQSELERQKQEQALQIKEKELALLKQNQHLRETELRNQQLEKQRVKQLLEITQQKARAERDRLLVEKQKEEAARLKLLAENERIEKEKQQKAREASEKQAELQQKQLNQEKSLRQYGIAIIGLVLVTLLLVALGLFNARRTARKLRHKNLQIEEQKAEIETQNEELYQNQEEILSQRDFIEEKNQELDTSNRQMRSSINSAMTIQQAILPAHEKLERLFKDYLLIYRPKDVVSGDFFWLNRIGDKNVLVAADCTGHGVPGAFMTLIGHTLLDKIIEVWRITEPEEILTRLHLEVQSILRQRQTGNNNGMDATVITWQYLNDDSVMLTFAGAKQDAYYINPGENQVQTLGGTRKSIGGEQNESRKFTKQQKILKRGSIVFAGSDGLVDQSNLKRKRFGKKRLIALLERPFSSLDEMCRRLEAALDDHQADTPQRDDILWLGFRL